MTVKRGYARQAMDSPTKSLHGFSMWNWGDELEYCEAANQPEENGKQWFVWKKGEENKLASLIPDDEFHKWIAEDPAIPVIFRKWKDSGSVIAFMPTLPSDVQNWYHCDSYMHVGQHGGADYSRLISQTVLATEEEYRDLKAELERYPYFYNFKVYQREHPWMRQEREKAWRKMMGKNE